MRVEECDMVLFVSVTRLGRFVCRVRFPGIISDCFAALKGVELLELFACACEPLTDSSFLDIEQSGDLGS